MRSKHAVIQVESKPLAGKVALVTGAAQGVGRGIAIELAKAGCFVAVNDRGEVRQTVAEIAALGGEALAVKADVRSCAQVRRMFATMEKRFERLDLLVNNAGTQSWAPLMELAEADWDRDIATNLKGSFLCLQAAARWMSRTGGGSIVNIGSGCSKTPFPRLVAYSASKGGVEMLTRVAAVELGPYGIRVNSVAPGAILIERTRQEDPHYAATWAQCTPLRRVGLPQDIGGAVIFLASERSAFVSGQTLWVDGGLFTQPVWPYKLADAPVPAAPPRRRKSAR
jgi:NAD(P)-dependent dehydrogenase (short-subunit alcohol dehydrogenase family)